LAYEPKQETVNVYEKLYNELIEQELHDALEELEKLKNNESESEDIDYENQKLSVLWRKS
jgi:hypothetical protein